MSDEAGGVRVRTFPGLCNGVGNCHRWAPHVYSLDADGLIAIHLLDVPPELAAEARIGAQVCPERAISIIEQPLAARTLAGRSVDTTKRQERDPMNITPDLLLAEIVDLAPGAPRVLESHGLDYCCGGQQTLLVACEGAHIDPAMVVAELNSLDPGPVPDWVPMSPALLVDHLETTHHAYLHDELPRLEALAAKVADVHASRHPELVELHRSCVALRHDLEPHMAKEEQVLFPMIRKLSAASSPPSFHFGSIANPITMLMREHEHTGSILGDMHRLTDGYRVPDDACASYHALYDALAALEADTHLHIHKENNALFPAVIELEQRWAAAV